MEARNRLLPEWFARVRTGQILLPRFQREEAWSSQEVNNLLDSVLHGLPVGAALILDIGDSQPFASRPMSGSPEPTERATEHLLDGQQRLTALWRSLTDDYLDRTYFVSLAPDPEDDDQGAPSLARSEGRWFRDGQRYPLWTDKPAEQHQRNLVPLRLLAPIDLADAVGEWCDEAVDGNLQESRRLERRIAELRQVVAAFNLPFLSLPVTTPGHVAIDVFIKLNTSSVPLSPFDIVVAQVEAATGTSLRDLADDLRARVPALESYITPADLILSTAALRQNRTPTQASYFRLDLDQVVDEWEALENGISEMVEMLESEAVYDRARLPTVAVLPILAAILSNLDATLDDLGNSRTILNAYMWRAFLTHRYEFAAGTKALQDYRGLMAAVRGDLDMASVPIFDEDLNPLLTIEEILNVGWPKGRDVLARGLLAISLKGGGIDLADGARVSRDSIRQREYHHLFPDSLLLSDGGLSQPESYRALNCALITWRTNRNIGAKEPIAYLRERVVRANLGEAEIRHRLASHVVPFDELNMGGYADISDPPQRADRIRGDYQRFITARAEVFRDAAVQLCRGEAWSPESGRIYPIQ